MESREELEQQLEQARLDLATFNRALRRTYELTEWHRARRRAHGAGRRIQRLEEAIAAACAPDERE